LTEIAEGGNESCAAGIVSWVDSQTFNISSSRDVVEKLRWELDQLAGTQIRDTRAVAYRSLNAAITAWHVCDWVYDECVESKDVRERLEAMFRKVAGLGDVQAWARQERAISICYQIATAAKHSRVSHRFDPNVRAQYRVDDRGMQDGTWTLVIYDGEEVRRPYDVLIHAHRFWTLALGWLEIR
jgi:hypothetical protein